VRGSGTAVVRVPRACLGRLFPRKTLVSSPLLDRLNEAQRAAAAHVEGPLLVLAGPGSGKTRVVTHRVANLIAVGVPAASIVALTFTNKAADEMRRRVADLVGPQPVEMGTFHRFAARQLRRHARLVGLTSDYSIFDPDDATAVLKRAAKKLGLALSHTPIDRISGVISRAKNDLLTPETFEPRWGRPADDVARTLWPIYQEMLLAANAVDFDDLLVHLARMLADDPELRSSLDARHKFILVDEYQDTNAVQYAIIRGLSIDHPNIAVTGDPDQAIYGWRGASIRNILEFERDYPAARVVTLEHNYRSTANILGTADRLIAHNSRRKPKRLVTSAEPGERVRIVLDASGQDEAERIAGEIAAAVRAGRRTPRDFAILFRTAALSRSLEIALRTAGVPYQLVRGLEFFKRREIRDVVAWLRLLRNPRDDEAFLRVVNVPSRGIGRQSLERLAAWAEDHGTSRLVAAAAADRIPGMPKKAARELPAFARLHVELGETAGREPSVAALLERVLDRTGYRRQLQDESEDDEEGLERLANVEELVTAARQHDESFAADPAAGGGEVDPLGAFLETTALVADADAWDAGAERVALMTFHAAKGLEFPVVYLVAMEDGILPHERSLDQPEQLEEERRLVFVGITRAREQLHASCARMRDYRGTRRISAPSVFLAEMTGSETVVEGDEAPAAGGRPVFDPFGDAARAAADEFADFHHEDEPPTAPRLKVFRPDGLTLETEESQVEGGEPAPQRVSGRKQRDRAPDRALDRAADLASWAMGQAGVPRVEAHFEPGQRVRHADYGEGVLVKISGVGTKSVGTVTFDGPAGTRKFLLGHGGILPAE
jgi:DNA helicase II / ATP-dependent DNA helicase PcrA